MYFDSISDEDGPRSHGIVDLTTGTVNLRKSAPMSEIRKLLREAPGRVGGDPSMAGFRVKGLPDAQLHALRESALQELHRRS